MENSKKNDFLDKKLRWDLLPLEEIEDIRECTGKIVIIQINSPGLENGFPSSD